MIRWICSPKTVQASVIRGIVASTASLPFDRRPRFVVKIATGPTDLPIAPKPQYLAYSLFILAVGIHLRVSAGTGRGLVG